MKKLLSLLIVSLVLFSCGKNDNRPIEEYLSSFLNKNKSIVLFGKADLNTILNKSEYKKIPKLGVALSKEVDAFKRSLNTETPIYFALEGPFLEDGTPKTSYAFFEVVNADSLVQKLTQQGFDLEKSGEIQYFQSGDVAFGVRNNLAILISKKDDFEGEKYIAEAFDKTTGDVAEGKISNILAADGDIVIGMSVQNLYETSNTDLQKLSADKRKSVKDMVEDSYTLTTMSFDRGAIVIDTKNMFSENMKSKMFFKKDPSASILKKLGTGDPKMGFATNIDMNKLQAFINEYSPETMVKLGESLGGPAAFILASGGENALSQLFSGEVGIVMVGNPSMNEGISDFNFYVGLGKQGKTFAEEMKGFLSAGMARVDLDGRGIAAYSSPNYIPMPGKRLSVPKGAENFGKKGVTAFINMENLDLSSMELEGEQKIIYLVKYVTFEMDENGSRIVIMAKDGKENILKQSVDVMVKELSGKIGNLTI